MIKLGDKVKCKLTGFTGIVISKVEYINGCIQYEIVPKVKSNGAYPDAYSIDETNLIVISPKPKQIKKLKTGGKTIRRPIRMSF